MILMPGVLARHVRISVISYEVLQPSLLSLAFYPQHNLSQHFRAVSDRMQFQVNKVPFAQNAFIIFPPLCPFFLLYFLSVLP